MFARDPAKTWPEIDVLTARSLFLLCSSLQSVSQRTGLAGRGIAGNQPVPLDEWVVACHKRFRQRSPVPTVSTAAVTAISAAAIGAACAIVAATVAAGWWWRRRWKRWWRRRRRRRSR